MSLEIESIHKSFGSFPAVNDVSLHIETGEMVAFLGPSGSGKTTLLRVIAGLEFADSGRIHFHGEDVTDKSANERKAGFVFQSYALFNHLTVFENIAFGLRIAPRSRRLTRAKIAERVASLLETIQLSGLANRFPSLFVTHDQEEAFEVADRVVIIDKGAIQQIGTPDEIRSGSGNTFVRDFLAINI